MKYQKILKFIWNPKTKLKNNWLFLGKKREKFLGGDDEEKKEGKKSGKKKKKG